MKRAANPSLEDLDTFLNDIPFSNAGNSPAGVFPPDEPHYFNGIEPDASEFGLQRAGSSDDDEKKQKQLERNRETAKRCRRRKREKTESLMEEVVRLRETNKELEIQLKIAKSKLGQTTSGRGNRGEAEEKRRIAEMKRLSEMIGQRCSDEEIMLRVKTFTEVYSDFGEERKKVLKTHVAQLESLLLPTKISKMLLWFLEQDETFFKSGEGSWIWQNLSTDLKIDEDQKRAFLSQRSKLGTQNVGFERVIRRLRALEGEILGNMQRRQEQMSEITSVFTPSQQAKFLHWVENNEACVSLLDDLWKKRTAAKHSAASVIEKSETQIEDDVKKEE